MDVRPRLCRPRRRGPPPLHVPSHAVNLVDEETVDMAYTFVDEALSKARSENNEKLIAEYEPMVHYFEEHRGPLKNRRCPPKDQE